MKKDYKKIDLWKLAEDTFTPDTYLELGIKIISWPFSFFKKEIPPFAKNDSRIKIMICLITINQEFDKLNERELKIACSIFDSPCVSGEKLKTIRTTMSNILKEQTPNNITVSIPRNKSFKTLGTE